MSYFTVKGLTPRDKRIFLGCLQSFEYNKEIVHNKKHDSFNLTVKAPFYMIQQKEGVNELWYRPDAARTPLVRIASTSVSENTATVVDLKLLQQCAEEYSISFSREMQTAIRMLALTLRTQFLVSLRKLGYQFPREEAGLPHEDF